jgi:hypothetical protein
MFTPIINLNNINIAVDNDENLIRSFNALNHAKDSIILLVNNHSKFIYLFAFSALYAILINYFIFIHVTLLQIWNQHAQIISAIINYNPSYFVMQLIVVALIFCLTFVISSFMVVTHFAEDKIFALEQELKKYKNIQKY